MARRPFVSIIGPSGGDLVPRLSDRLIAIKIVDQAGAESDTLTFVVRIDHPFPAGPAKGTRYLVNIGWTQEGARPAGVYTVQNVTIGGDPEAGYQMTVDCRSSDFIDAMKKVDSGHFDDETVGDIFNKVAGEAGMSAVVDPELASIRVPYRLRWNQPSIDFLDDLARETGGTLKLAGGRLLMMKRGAGRSAGGTAFPPVVVRFADCYGFDISIESRGEYQEIGGDWFDPAEGALKLVESSGIGKAGRYLPVHPFASDDEARRGAAAYGKEEARKRVSGSFDLAGSLLATAEAPVRPQGFGPDIDGLDLICSAAIHEVDFGEDGGWVTTIEVESAGEAKVGGGGEKSGAGSGGGGGGGSDTVPDWEIPAGGPNAGE